MQQAPPSSLSQSPASEEGATEVRYARVTLFETLPILMYLDEAALIPTRCI